MNLYCIECLMFTKNNNIKLKREIDGETKCRKNTKSKNPKVVKTKNWRMMLLSNCAVCNSKKSRFTKEQETSELLLGPNSPFSRIPLIGCIL